MQGVGTRTDESSVVHNKKSNKSVNLSPDNRLV